MEGKILFDISHLRFEGNGIADVNAGSLFLTNNDELRNEFYTEKFIRANGIGDIRYTPSSVFAFCQTDLTNTDGKLDEEIRLIFEEVMAERMQLIEGFLWFTWFIKDNSVGLWSTFGQIKSRNIINKISRSFSFYNCQGTKDNCSFSKEQLTRIGELTQIYQNICPRPLKTMREMIFTYEFDQHGMPFRTYLQRYTNAINYNDQNCIERAFHFLSIARSQTVLIYKIAYYLAIFESLFTTDSTEINKKMSNRAAFYIGESQEEYEYIFITIFDSYKIRSKFLHGQVFESDDDIETTHLLRTAEELDQILRKVLLKIMTKDAEIFSKYDITSRSAYLNSFLPKSLFLRKNFTRKV